MEMYFRITGLFAIGLLVVGSFSHRFSRELPIILFLFFAPFSYFGQNIGVVVEPSKLMAMLFAAYIFFNHQILNVWKYKYLFIFFPLYIYLLLSTVFISPMWPSGDNSQQGVMYSGVLRGYTQLIQIFLGLSIVTLFVYSIDSIDSILRSIKSIMFSLFTLCVYGLYVWTAQMTGLPFNPINRQGGGGAAGHVISESVDGIKLIRAYSFSGEPKQLASQAALGLAMLASGFRTHLYQSRNLYTVVSFLVFSGALFLTFSTAGYLLLPAMLIVPAGIILLKGSIRRRSVLLLGAAGLLLVFAPVYFAEAYLDQLIVIFNARIFDRLSEYGLFTYAEQAVLEIWRSAPYLSVTGVGLGGSTFFIREFDAESYAGFVAAPRGVIGFIADRGLIGLTLFLVPLLICYYKMIRVAKSVPAHAYVYYFTLVASLLHVVMLFTTGQWSDEWIAVSLAASGAIVAGRDYGKFE